MCGGSPGVPEPHGVLLVGLAPHLVMPWQPTVEPGLKQQMGLCE